MPPLQIRAFCMGDESALHEVFHSSVHTLGAACYDAAQLAAWAPNEFDATAWAAKMRTLRPFVATRGAHILGYADLGAAGYIDHFFVAGAAAHRGVGTALMQHLLAQATARQLSELSADVSRCAQRFFAHHGFELVQERTVLIRAVALANARMRRALRVPYSTSSL